MKNDVAVCENERVRFAVSLAGGAFRSLVDLKSGEELMWSGDPEWWADRDVFIFPFCGRCKDGFYTHRGKRYELDIHGFAKDSAFSVVEKTRGSVTLELASSPETLKVYPFPFVVRLTYAAEGSAVKVRYEVRNAGEERMYFGMGAHFGVKLCEKDGDTLGNFVEFDRPADEIFPIAADPFLLPEKRLDPPIARAELGKAFFRRYDTFIADTHGKGGGLTVRRADGRKLRFAYDSPYIALWSEQGGGAFACVEPWWGLCDEFTPVRELCEKKGLVSLAAGESFVSGWSADVDPED